MEQIIENLLASDNDRIQRGTTDLQEAYKRPETIPELCQIIVSSPEPQVRQYAAVLLRKRLMKLRHWQMVPKDQQEIIKQGMLNALVQEQVKNVRNAIALFVGVLVRHEAGKNETWMTDVLKFIYTLCSSSDPNQSELGSSIFATLTDAAADQFIPHMESVCEMFTAALIATEASGNMATPVIYNILIGMTYLVPFILGHNAAEHTYQRALPLVIKSLRAFAVQENPDNFVRAFDILDSMADYTPKLLTTNIRLLLDFCMEVANNAELASPVRVKAVSYIGWLVRLKKKIIIKQKLVQPIIQVVFNLMSTEPENGDDDEEDYFLGDDNSTPMTTATQTMDLLALNIPPEKLIPPLLTLLEPALQGQNPLPRRAAYLTMAVIAEGCSEAICNKYLEQMLAIIKAGITDQMPIVRNAAFFALGQFSEHLQPEITHYAPEIMPILFEFLHQLSLELGNGGAEPKHIDRMFYALETFCENLEDELVPHLPILMQRLFEAVNPSNSVRVRELALSAISAVANASKENLYPYFDTIIGILKPYLEDSKNEDIISLRSQAIDTLASVARTIGKQNFLPLANQSMEYALTLLESADDPDIRRAIYNLIASLAEVVNEEMAPIYPKIMDRVFESILSTEEVIPEYKDDEIDIPDPELDADDIDIENSDGEDDAMDNIAGYSVENGYLDEKEEAILAIKEFARHSTVAFRSYLPKAYENVYKMIDHPQEDIRRVSIDALVAFIIQYYKLNDYAAVNETIQIVIKKLNLIVNEDEEVGVVIAVLDGYADLLKELKSAALPTEELRDLVFSSIYDVLQGKVACQFDEPVGDCDDDADESEYDEALVESAGSLLPVFGRAMTPEKFAMYFGRAYPIILQKLEKAKKQDDLASQRAFAYGTLAECFGPLQKCSATFLETFIPVLLVGVRDTNEQARQNAIFGLGELILNSEEKSYGTFPMVLGALSQAVADEKVNSALDNICGAIARLILTNYQLLPLSQVLSVFISKLPLREDFEENDPIFKSLKLLFINQREVLEPHIEKILTVSLITLEKKEYGCEETADIAISLLKAIRDNYPGPYEAIANANPGLYSLLQNI